MQEVDVKEWEDFERHVSELRRRHDAASLLFRGLGDSMWPLTTTLERNGYVGMLFAGYYRIVAASKPQIETFTNASWDIPEYPEIERLGHEYDEFSLDLTFGRFRGYGYMAYLRHQGFPSPLLDWSKSPYIAAFFAFRSPDSTDNGQGFNLRLLRVTRGDQGSIEQRPPDLQTWSLCASAPQTLSPTG